MQVISFPNPILKTRCKEIDPTTEPRFKETVAEMIDLMRKEEGVGLAAIQVGIAQKFFIYDDSEKQDDPRVLVNPVIVSSSDETAVSDEGCLSFPGVYFEVERPEAVVVEGLDEHGNKVRLEADELLARILQHEIDHLNGVVILDRATPEVRREVIREHYRG